MEINLVVYNDNKRYEKVFIKFYINDTHSNEGRKPRAAIEATSNWIRR
jgi:hypothetical protein